MFVGMDGTFFGSKTFFPREKINLIHLNIINDVAKVRLENLTDNNMSHHQAWIHSFTLSGKDFFFESKYKLYDLQTLLLTFESH